jgi:hypothetical protein
MTNINGAGLCFVYVFPNHLRLTVRLSELLCPCTRDVLTRLIERHGQPVIEEPSQTKTSSL